MVSLLEVFQRLTFIEKMAQQALQQLERTENSMSFLEGDQFLFSFLLSVLDTAETGSCLPPGPPPGLSTGLSTPAPFGPQAHPCPRPTLAPGLPLQIQATPLLAWRGFCIIELEPVRTARPPCSPTCSALCSGPSLHWGTFRVTPATVSPRHLKPSMLVLMQLDPPPVVQPQVSPPLLQHGPPGDRSPGPLLPAPHPRPCGQLLWAHTCSWLETHVAT